MGSATRTASAAVLVVVVGRSGNADGTGQRGASQRRARRPARPIFSWSPLKTSVGQNHVFRAPGPVLSQPQRSTNERTCDGVYSPSTGTSATRLSFLSLRDSGLALHPSLARGHFLARFCTAVFPLAGGGSITVSLVVSNGRSAPKASHLIGSSLP